MGITWPSQMQFDVPPKVEKLPRSYRLWCGCNSSLDLYLLLVEAQYSRDKRRILKQANLELEKPRHLWRLSQELTDLSLKSYHYICAELDQVGKMIGGWQKNS